MQDSLQITLLVLGLCAILGVFLHGLWSAHKERSAQGNIRGNTARAVKQPRDSDDNNVNVDNKFVVGITRSADADSRNHATKPDIHGTTAAQFELSTEGSRQDAVSSAVTPADLHPPGHVASDGDVDVGDSTSQLYANVVVKPKPEMISGTKRPSISMPKGVPVQSTQDGDSIPDPAAQKVVDDDSCAREDNPPPPSFLLKTHQSPSTFADEPRKNINDRVEMGNNQGEDGLNESLPEFTLSSVGADQSPADVEYTGEDQADATQGFFSGVKQSAKKFISSGKSVSLKDRIKKEPRIKTSAHDDQLQIPFSALDDTSSVAMPSAKHSYGGQQITAGDSAVTLKRRSADAETDQSQTQASQASEPAEEVLVINVFANEGEVFQGASLLPVLLTLHFKFGEQDIFHRHAENTGRGPILFSLASAIKPGTFDLDNMERFSTEGISLFMILPLAEAQQAFNMMLNSANKIANELNGRVLDDQRSAMTQQRIKHYVDRIREFERLQLISRGGAI